MAHDPVEPGASTLQGTLVADKYQILGAVASGGMGTVYRARHLHLDRDVAIKLMHARHFDNREYMARFRLEAQKAAGLEHPGIVEVRDFGEDAKIRVRGVRREYNDLFKEAEKDKDISEDDLKRALAKVQTITDEYVGLVDGMIGAKEKEILEV